MQTLSKLETCDITLCSKTALLRLVFYGDTPKHTCALIMAKSERNNYFVCIGSVGQCQLPLQTNLFQNWCVDYPQCPVKYFPPNSPFLNPVEELFSWWWKVFDRHYFCVHAPAGYGRALMIFWWVLLLLSISSQGSL